MGEIPIKINRDKRLTTVVKIKSSQPNNNDRSESMSHASTLADA